MGKHKEKKHKKHKKEKKHKKTKRKHKSSSSSTSDGDWVEKELLKCEEKDIKERESWMSLSTSFNSYLNTEKREERKELKRLDNKKSTYQPKTSERELNPYWKDGGNGLPSENFKKPVDDNEIYGLNDNSKNCYSSQQKPSLNWQKKEVPEISNNYMDVACNSKNSNKIMSDNEMNIIAAKLVKAEIMGNIAVIYELRQKLEDSRKAKEDLFKHEQTVLLTESGYQGFSRPLKSDFKHEEYPGSSSKKQKVETHHNQERIRYFFDDDKYSLKQMFENEKFNSTEDENREFVRLASQNGKNDSLDDLFSDNIRRKKADDKIDKRCRDKAVRDYQNITQTLENCSKCIQSDNMLKHLMVAMGETFYLSLPHHEPLTEGHCLIVPTRHVSCCTNLEENEWSELLNFRKALVRLCESKNEEIVFIETAMFLSRRPHMCIQCIPLPNKIASLAPIYFKKAINESETEWSTNKKLVSLSGRDVRKAIPKGLPYFSVSFGMTEGFAHVIEDQRLFPVNFGQEIIGGMLDLHHNKWKKPKKQTFSEQKERVLKFSEEWSKHDCTKS